MVFQRETPTEFTVKLETEFHLLCIRVDSEDNISSRNCVVNDMVVRIFSQREIMLYLRDEQMRTVIEEMKAYLLT